MPSLYLVRAGRRMQCTVSTNTTLIWEANPAAPSTVSVAGFGDGVDRHSSPKAAARPLPRRSPRGSPLVGHSRFIASHSLNQLKRAEHIDATVAATASFFEESPLVPIVESDGAAQQSQSPGSPDVTHSQPTLTEENTEIDVDMERARCMSMSQPNSAFDAALSSSSMIDSLGLRARASEQLSRAAFRLSNSCAQDGGFTQEAFAPDISHLDELMDRIRSLLVDDPHTPDVRAQCLFRVQYLLVRVFNVRLR